MKNKLIANIIALIVLTNITGCISTGDIEGIVDKGGKAAGTVILASAGKTLANSKELKAKMNKKYGKDLMAAIAVQPIEEKSILLIHSMDTKVEVAKNTWWKGFNLGLIVGSVLWFLLVIGKYVFDRYKLRPKTITY